MHLIKFGIHKNGLDLFRDILSKKLFKNENNIKCRFHQCIFLLRSTGVDIYFYFFYSLWGQHVLTKSFEIQADTGRHVSTRLF